MEEQKSILQRAQEAWKFIIAMLPVLAFGLTSIVAALNDSGIAVPPWAATLVTFITALGVYFKRNAYSPSTDSSTPGPNSQTTTYYDSDEAPPLT